MFMRRLRKDKRGLSLIELVCALAILGIITMTVGGAMVVASDSYRQGTSEAALQQETQFTANSIESLIIDATDTVTWDGTVLKIENTDFTYEIKYDGTANRLTYTQYETGNPSNKVVEDALLAENVDTFEPNVDEFATARNVRLKIGMRNATTGVSFETTYNITSRNDPDAGAPVTISAAVQCLDEIVLEPLQTYNLQVSVVGPAGVTYTAQFLPDGGNAVDATAVTDTTNGLVTLSIGATEDGDTDGKITLRISTSVNKADGTPIYKDVSVRIRRVNEINLSALTITNGQPPLEAGTEYSISATPAGTNLEQVVGAVYDNDYVNPNTVMWSFEMSNGDAWTDWVDVLGPGRTSNTLTFALKQDITTGVSMKVRATAYHPEGAEINGAWSNKASAATNSVSEYTTVDKFVTLQKGSDPYFPDDNIRRGTENWAYDDFIYQDMIEDNWNYHNPGTEMPDNEDYNSGYEGNMYFRFKSEDGVHTSDNYPAWKWMANQGDSSNHIKFNAGDFDGMYYMKKYELQVVFSFKYKNMDNQDRLYPIGFEPGDGGTPEAQYIYTWPINPMSVQFDVAKDANGSVIDLSPYLTGNADGIGTQANPLPLTRGSATIQYCNITGATNDRGAFSDLLNGAKLYRWAGSTWTDTNNRPELQKATANSDQKSGTLTLNTQNLTPGKYKIVFGKIDEIDSNGEVYANEPVEGMGGRGIIYFDVNS